MKRKLELCIQGYIEDYQLAFQLDDEMVHPMNYIQWKEEYEIRSHKLRGIFHNNNDRLTLLHQYVQMMKDFSNLVDDYAGKEELATDLMEAARLLYEQSCDDYCVFQLLCEPLISYYEQKDQLAQCVELYSMMSFESYHFYSQISGEDKNLKSTIEYCQKVIASSDRFDEIASEKTIKYYMLAFSNLIAPLSQYDLTVRSQMFDTYAKAKDFYHQYSSFLEKDDPLETAYRFDIPLLSSEAWINSLNEEQIQILKEICQRLENTKDFVDYDGNLYRTKQTLAIYFQKKSVDEVINEYIDFIHQLPDPDYSLEETDEIFDQIINYFNTAWNVFELFDNFQIDEASQHQYTSRFVDKVTNVLMQVPYNFQTAVFHEVCSLWYSRASLYLTSFEEKDALLKKMILCRQPMTYIHSQMVKNLAVTISKSILKNHPDYFANVSDKQEEVLHFIGEGALLHDIGKCAIVGVVNTQFRRLSDVEFGLIRLHPEKSLQIIYKSHDFEHFYDIMIGHHKSYDDLSGYPTGFVHQKSKIANVIDLISICDSMDAATDFYGRNYVPGKDFAALEKELEKFKGTRYNPTLVDWISDDQQLLAELKDITENKRSEVCYQVCRELLNIKK